jgi:hypothetical protein
MSEAAHPSILKTSTRTRPSLLSNLGLFRYPLFVQIVKIPAQHLVSYTRQTDSCLVPLDKPQDQGVSRMARTKSTWSGHLAGRPEPGSRVGRITIPVELDNQDGREVKINIPVSRVPGLIRQLQKAYDTGTSLTAWRQA